MFVRSDVLKYQKIDGISAGNGQADVHRFPVRSLHMKYCIWNVSCGKQFSEFMTYEECMKKLKDVPSWMTTCIPDEETVREWMNDRS